MRPHHKFQICPWCWPPHYCSSGVSVLSTVAASLPQQSARRRYDAATSAALAREARLAAAPERTR
jgi:hypothetical protein